MKTTKQEFIQLRVTADQKSEIQAAAAAAGLSVSAYLLSLFDKRGRLLFDVTPLKYPKPEALHETQGDLECMKCRQIRPIADFVVERITGKTVTHTCSECRVPRENTRVNRQVSNHRQRAKKLGVVNTLTTDEWQSVVEQSGGLCFYCRADVGKRNLLIEHIVPLTKGGANSKENVVPSCVTCNRKKAARRLLSG